MNSLFSGLLALFVAFASICAGVGAPVSADVNVRIDGDLSYVAAGQAPALSMLNNLSFYGAAAPAAAEFTVRVDGDPAATVSIRQTEDGWSAASNLLPTTELTVKNETLQSQQAQDIIKSMIPFNVDEMQQKLNPEAVQSLLAPLTDVISTFMQSRGEPETGEFTVDGVTYPIKLPFNITYKEAITALVNAGKQILESESAAQVLAMFGRTIDADSLDATLEALDAPEDTLPVLEIAQYTDGTAAFAFEGKLSQGSAAYVLNIAFDGSVGKASLTMLGMKLLELGLNIDNEKGCYEVTANVNAGASQVSLISQLQKTATGYDSVTNIIIPTSAESSAAITASISISNNEPIYKAPEDGKTVALEDLAGENSEAADAFGMELKQSIIDVAKGIVEAHPDMAPLFQNMNILPAETVAE